MAGHNQHISLKTYWIVFASLMLLLVVSVLAALVDLGAWNLPLALAISAAKAALVMLYFMHLINSRGLVPITACAALLWLVFLFLLAAGDYAHRPPADTQPSEARRIEVTTD